METIYRQIRILSLFLLATISAAKAQNTSALQIGSPAPEIQYSQWLQGTPISSFEDGKLYVLEFWATWCGACIGAMPHLSDLAKKYGDKVHFLGVNVQEQTKGQPYETTLPKVLEFIKSDLNKMTFPGFADNNSEYMKTHWLEAAGTIGLPNTFVVKDGLLIWVGHPAALDDLIDSFIDNTFDVQAFKISHEQRREELEKGRAISNALESAMDNKEYTQALKIIDEQIATSPGPYYKMKKFDVLFNGFGDAKALAYLNQLDNEQDNAAVELANTIPYKENLPIKIYQRAIDILKSEPIDYSSLGRIALAYSKSGKKNEAIKTMEQAISLVELEIKSHPDEILLQKRLVDYNMLLDKLKTGF